MHVFPNLGFPWKGSSDQLCIFVMCLNAAKKSFEDIVVSNFFTLLVHNGEHLQVTLRMQYVLYSPFQTAVKQVHSAEMTKKKKKDRLYNSTA